MNKSVAKGSIILIFSGLVCKILGAFFRLPLTSILGVEGIGVFQMIMSLYSFALILCSGGMTVTLSKLVSEARAKGDGGRIKSLQKISILTSVLIGAVIGLLFFLFAKNISLLQGSSEAESGYMLMIFLLPLGGVIACLRGVIQGREDMLPTAISQIIEQAVKFILGLLLASVFIKKSVGLGVFGAFLGIVISEVFACIYLLFNVRKTSGIAEKKEATGFFATMLPILLGMSVLPLVNAIDSLIIVSRLGAAGIENTQAVMLFGLQTGVVGAILNLPLIVSTSLAAAILPSISYLSSQNENTEEKISKAFKILWIIVLPTVIGIISIAKPLYSLIYPSLDEVGLMYAVNLTRLGGIATIITSFMQFFVSILQAKGKLFYLMTLQLVGGCVKILMVVFLCAIPEINIYGLVLGNIAMSSIVSIGCLVALHGQVSLTMFDLTIPLASSILMMFGILGLVLKLPVSNLLLVLLSTIFGVLIYGVLCLPCFLGMFKELKFMRKKKENLLD